MVAALLRLRFRVLANTLGRNPLQLVAVVLGAIPVMGVVAVGLLGLLAASQQPARVAQLVIVAGGTLTLVGWLLVPLFLDIADDALDPRRLAGFPIRPSQLMTATILAGLAWFPGAATLIVSVGTALAWIGSPAIALASAATGVVATVTCLVGARAVTGLAGILLDGGAISRMMTVVLVLGLIAAPLAPAVVAGASGDGSQLQTALAALEVLAWTPFGAVWSIPGRIALGDTAGAIGATAVAIASLAALTLVWRLALRAASDSPGGAAKRPTSARSLGALAWAPTGTAGAVAARSLIYWLRDARRARQLLLIPAVPLAMLLWWRLLDMEPVALAIGPTVAALLPLSAFADLSYDGTAFASQFAAGFRGRDDRFGRAAALLILGVPTVILVQVPIALLLGRADDLPALLGLSGGMLLTSIGVTAVSSALLVVPVPRPGRNPFSTPAGAATMSIIASYAVLGATLVAASPVIALAVASFVTGSPPMGWGTLACGAVVGATVLAAGISLGGRALDRTAPTLLMRLRLDRD